MTDLADRIERAEDVRGKMAAALEMLNRPISPQPIVVPAKLYDDAVAAGVIDPANRSWARYTEAEQEDT